MINEKNYFAKNALLLLQMKHYFIIKGSFKNDLLDGHVVDTSIQGDKFVGQFKKGMYNGKGIFTYSNGDEHEG